MTQKVPARASPLLLPDASHIGSSAVLPGEKSEGHLGMFPLEILSETLITSETSSFLKRHFCSQD